MDARRRRVVEEPDDDDADGDDDNGYEKTAEDIFANASTHTETSPSRRPSSRSDTARLQHIHDQKLDPIYARLDQDISEMWRYTK